MKKQYMKPTAKAIEIDASAILAGSTRNMTMGRKSTDSDFPIASEPSDNPWGLDGIIGE